MTIHLITNCTSKKSSKLKNTVNINEVINTTRPNLVDWVNAIYNNPEKSDALNVYAGDHWSIAREIHENKIPLWIISAGFGFINSTTKICAYNATFSSNDLNSVGQYYGTNSLLKNNRRWWEQLHDNRGIHFRSEHSFTSMIRKCMSDTFFIVSSPSYLKVIEPELEELTLKGYLNPENTFIITSKIKLSENLKPMHYIAIEDFCTQLKGSRISLNIRLARFLMLGIDESSNIREQINKKYNDLLRASTPALKFNREKISDSNLESFILKQLSSSGSSKHSATSLLRDLRKLGFACEQKRFGKIFKMTQINLHHEEILL